MNDKFFMHNIYMAEIANCIVDGRIPFTDDSKLLFSKNARYQEGVREIIGLYLLIPYINNDQNRLKYNKPHDQISILEDNYIAFHSIDGRAISIKNLRDTICHSFVSCDLGAYNEPVIVFDDRAIQTRYEHELLENKDMCVLVKSNEVLKFLKKAYNEIFNEYNKDST